MSNNAETESTENEKQLTDKARKLLEKIANVPQPDLKAEYRGAVDYLDDNFAYFLTHVLNIGQPRWTSAVPTAAVMVEKDKNANDFTFVFSPDFVKMLQLEEFRGKDLDPDEAIAFILAHETMHILLNHLKLCKANRFKDHQRFNIAADCVINDYLVGMGLKAPKGLCLGEDLVGYNCANSTVTDVYNDLPESCPECGGTGEVDEDQDGDEGDSGEGGKQPCPRCHGSGGGYPGQQIDDHGWMHDSTADQQQKADQAGRGNKSMPSDLDRTKKDADYQSNLNPGVGVGGKQAFMEDKGVGLKWAELLEKINPFAFKRGPKPRPAWNRRPRKITAMPDTMLPTREEGKEFGRGNRPAIVMALDTSGSIGQEQANQFVNMARSIPQEKIKLYVCTFTTQYEELDLENPEWSSGGTHFDCITDYITEKVMPDNRKRYPSAVVVVTDGYATFSAKRPDKGQEKSWYWLLTPNGVGSYGDPLPGETDELDKFQRGGK
jgi:predicted metal-dependent peptidase